MARHYKALLHANELEETRTRPEQTEDSQSQGETGHHHDVPTRSLQRAIARPGMARPQDLRAVSQTYGNKAVMRMVEKARLERQTAAAGPTIQRQPITSTIQRIGGEDGNETQKQQIKAKLKKAKVKEKLLLGGQKVGRAFKELLTMPIKMFDQLSVVDLHLKDFKNFIKTKKTRKQRYKESKDFGDKERKYKIGNLKRLTGRTGLTGYAHGVLSHNVMYGGSSSRLKVPLLSTRANPLNLLHKVNAKGLEANALEISNLEKQLEVLGENPEQELEQDEL